MSWLGEGGLDTEQANLRLIELCEPNVEQANLRADSHDLRFVPHFGGATSLA